jgi:hypothetical protein
VVLNGLLKGINFGPGPNQDMYIGNGTTAGTLATGAAGLSTEWPTIPNSYATRVVLNGASGSRSALNVDGIKFTNQEMFVFQDWYDIQKFDNVTMALYYPGGGYSSHAQFMSCTNALVTDTTWSGWSFPNALPGGTYNIRADGTNCNSTYLPQIFMTSWSGAGGGIAKELDPNNRVFWLWQPSNKDIYVASNGTAWSQGLTASGGSGSYTYSLPTAPGGASIDGSGVASYTPAAQGTSAFTARVTDTGAGSVTEDWPFTLDTYAAGVCVWTGATSVTWATASNWSFCGGGAPIATNDVAFYKYAPFMPTVSANTTVNSIAQGLGGGTVTVNNTRTLTLTATTNNIQSNVTFQGSITTCGGNCQVSSNGIEINQGATVTLLKGIAFNASNADGTSGIQVGDGATSGHLETGAAGTYAEWPTIYSKTGNVSLTGTAGIKSSVNLDGAKFTEWIATEGPVLFNDYYDIVKFDNIDITPWWGAPSAAWATIKFANCTNATITDTSWTNINFNNFFGVGHNIRADGTNCATTLPAISVGYSTVGSNVGYGTAFETDPGGVINWPDNTVSICTWTGAASTSWTNPANWSGCTNGRNGYPDVQDWVVIPVTATQPLISQPYYYAIQGVWTGTGGGTISVNQGWSGAFSFASTTNTIQSNVHLQYPAGPYNGTSTLGNFEISSGATLTLDKYTTLVPRGDFRIGNGGTGGNLSTGNAASSAEWPVIASAGGANKIVVYGVGGQKSVVNFNGIYLSTATFGGGVTLANHVIEFKDQYDIQGFDNVTINTGNWTGAAGSARVYFSDCTNGTWTDSTWTGLNLTNAIAATYYNVRADGTACNTMPTVNINGATGAGACGAVGSGACTQENDPNSKIDWN